MRGHVRAFKSGDMSPHSKNGCCREMTAGEHSGHELAATGPRTGYSNRGSTSSRRVPTRNCPTSVQWNGSTSFKKRYSNMRENLVGTYGLGQCYLITTTSLLHLQIQRVCRNSSANFTDKPRNNSIVGTKRLGGKSGSSFGTVTSHLSGPIWRG